MIRNILLASLLFVLIACQQSVPKNYYLLTPLSPITEKETTNINQLLGLGPVELADYLKRPNIVRVHDNNTLNLTTNDYWAEPLDKGIVRVLSLNLVRQNVSRMVLSFPWRSDRIPPYSFRIDIHELVSGNHQASINATWELVRTADKKSIKREHFIRSVKSENNAASIAYAYSDLLAQLSMEMNKALLQVSE